MSGLLQSSSINSALPGSPRIQGRNDSSGAMQAAPSAVPFLSATDAAKTSFFEANAMSRMIDALLSRYQGNRVEPANSEDDVEKFTSNASLLELANATICIQRQTSQRLSMLMELVG